MTHTPLHPFARYRKLSRGQAMKLPIHNLLRLMKKVRLYALFSIDRDSGEYQDRSHYEYLELLKSVAATKPHHKR